MANELKPCPFCGSKARMWPSQTKSDSEGSYEIIGCSNIDCLIEPTTDEYLPYAEAVIRWNTRPAAPVEGLETVKWQVKDFADSWFTVDNELGAQAAAEHYGSLVRELVTRSQAEAIIAAKEEAVKSRINYWSEHYAQQHDRAEKAEDENAALTARVKELDGECNDLVKRNNDAVATIDNWINSCAASDEKVQALETQLAAARKALTVIAEAPAWGFPEKWETTPAEVRQLARAALECKPS